MAVQEFDENRQLANAREEQQMSDENDERNEPVRTAANLIQEAARVVNWTPDEKHSQQARYDAHRAMMSMFAYWTAVSMEALRRLNPAIAEAVATHIDNDLDWPTAHEHAYGWEQTLNAGGSIAVDAWPFWEIVGQPDTQPAGEHHVGTLDLSGEGNGPAAGFLLGDGVIEEAAQAACEYVYPPKTHKRWDAVDDFEQDSWRATANVVLESAYPAIRQQVAEEIAVAIAARRAEITEGRPGWVYLGEAIEITQQIGGLGVDATASGSAGGASARTGLSASPSDPPAGKAGRSESGGSE